MAEIKIEKKFNAWGWVIGAIIAIALIGWFILADTDGAPETSDIETVDTELRDTELSSAEQKPRAESMEAAREEILANPNSQLKEYTAFIGNKSKMGLDHEYTSEAMIKLVNATIEKAVVADVNIDTELKSAVQKAQMIKKDPMDTDHADSIKKAYLSITDVIQKVQEEKYPNLKEEVNQVRMAASKLNPAVLTLNQKEEVNNYFDKAAAALQQMSKEQ